MRIKLNINVTQSRLYEAESKMVSNFRQYTSIGATYD